MTEDPSGDEQQADDPGVRLPDRFARPWLRSGRPVPRRAARPLERFLHTEVGSGAILLFAAFAALVWSNLGTGSYEEFWTTPVHVELGSLSLEEDLRHLVNELLMALFFYVVALEVKREILFGSLREGRSAGVPVAAAFGTMVGAAAVYLAINLGGGEPSGWAIPIATDIAFVLAVLGIAGRRVPRELRAFMLTLAVVDDLGTIAVIAFFFSQGLAIAWLLGAAAAACAVLVLQRLGVRLLVPYVVLAAVLWLAIYEAGVHGTLAGVVLAFLTPAIAFYPRDETGEVISGQLADIAADPQTEVGEATMWEASRAAREAVSPLARMESSLHPWSAYVVLPIFALANAGVPVSIESIGDALTSQVGLGVIAGLVIGAPLGGILLAWAFVRGARSPLPTGLDWSAIAGATPLKGIGFTVAIFLAVLALEDPAQVEHAKLAILIASVLAAAIGLLALWGRHRMSRENRPE